MPAVFIIENNIVKPSPEILLIEPFKTIWRKDKDRNKRNAIKAFSYIEFMTSQRKTNPFRQYPDELKSKKIIEYLYDDIKDFKLTDRIKEGMLVAEEFLTSASVTYRYYKSNVKAAEKIIEFFNTFDFNTTTKSGNPLYKPADITRAINDATKTLQTLKSLESKVQEEIFESSKKKAGKEISPFAMK